MSVIKDTPGWVQDTLRGQCQSCGETEAAVAWQYPAGGVLRLCPPCAVSVCGGLLVDVALSGHMTVGEVGVNVAERYREVRALRSGGGEGA